MYGPYVKYGKKNYKIPKGGKDATDLTLEDTLAIIGKDIKQPDKAETSFKGKGSKARKSHKKTMLSK
jgi:DNA topoisomerase-1